MDVNPIARRGKDIPNAKKNREAIPINAFPVWLIYKMALASGGATHGLNINEEIIPNRIIPK